MQKGTIYIIRDRRNKEVIYTGGTTTKFNIRRSNHFSRAKLLGVDARPIHKHMNVEGLENFEIVDIMTVDVNDLAYYERMFEDIYKPTMNKQKSYHYRRGVK